MVAAGGGHGVDRELMPTSPRIPMAKALDCGGEGGEMREQAVLVQDPGPTEAQVAKVPLCCFHH